MPKKKGKKVPKKVTESLKKTLAAAAKKVGMGKKKKK